VYGRMINSIYYMFPVGFISDASRIMTGIFIVFLLWGVVNWLKSLYKKIKTTTFVFPESVTESLPVLLGIVWIVSGSIVFWLMSPYFANRYFHLVSYGSGLLVAYFILNTEFHGKSVVYRKYGSAALLILVLLMISNKIHWQYNYISVQNLTYNEYKNELMKSEYPPDSQIIVVGQDILDAGGWWNYSSGYLQYITGRADIMGNISYPEMQFYNPFDPAERRFSTHMTGIDLEKPVYLFRKAGGHFNSVKYALQWEFSGWTAGAPGKVYLGTTSPEELIQSPWRIYEFDFITGEHTILKEGKGLDSYQEAINNLSKIGITEKEILWAGPMSGRSEMRFGFK